MSITGLTQKEIYDISPENPRIPDPLSFSEAPTFTEIQTHLWLIGASFEHYDKNTSEVLTPWLLHTYPISFRNGQEKEIWRKNTETYRFRCFSDFWKEPLEWQNTRIGVFWTKRENWVGNPRSDDLPFHAWAAILNPDNKLLIYDCNTCDKFAGQDQVHIRELMDMQQRFIQHCQRIRRINIRQVWIIGDGRRHTTNKSLQRTSAWLQEVVKPEGDLSWTNWPWDDTYLTPIGATRVKLSDTGQRPVSRSNPRNKLAVPTRWEFPRLRSRARS
jgi:hypothetical protein